MPINESEWKADMIENLRYIFEDGVDVATGTTRKEKIKNHLSSGDLPLEILKILMDSESTENASMQRAMMILPYAGDAKRMQQIKDEMENPTSLT